MSWENGTHDADDGMYGANTANGAVGAYDGHGARPDPAGPPQSPTVYQPQGDLGPTPVYDAYADPAAAHGWHNGYDATAELPVMSGIGAEAEASATGAAVGVVAGGHRRKKSASGRRGVVVGVVAAAVGVVAVGAVIVGFGGSDAPSGGGAPSTVEASVTPGEEPAATDSSDPTGTGPASEAPASPGSAQSVPGDSTSDTPSAAPAASASPSSAASPTTTATGDSGPGNSENNPGRGKDGTKGPK
ncbi:hypothetical protein ACH4TV_10765 [Streptomyces sp. NPDC020898]|uniref:hypothetical protein n=1 Tax=Streptomyces sp. NPDC020898 TaxID=3365101 RepID=UPI00378D6085